MLCNLKYPGEICVELVPVCMSFLPLALADNLGFRNAYDRIIRCMGFKFDFSIFTSSAQPDPSPVGDYDKYPNIRCNYESSSVQDMFFGQ